MDNKLGRVLLTNDDGIDAHGLKILESIAAEIADDVWVVAPEKNCSGFGRSVTIQREIKTRKIDARHFACDGTPTDCVIFALNHLLGDTPPDLVLSGINLGMNISDDVGSSGTVGAAWQATVGNVPAIALSQKYDSDIPRRDPETDFDCVRHHGLAITRALIRRGWPQSVFFNVNFPSIPADSIKGVRGVRMASHTVTDEINMGTGEYTYRINKDRGKGADTDSDIGALFAGYITITPLSIDMTDDDTLRGLDRINI